MGRKDEKLLAEEVATWIQTQHPNVPYRFDLAADIPVKQFVILKYNKRLHPYKGYLDLWIANPAGEFHGAYIELKADGKSPYLKDGITLKKNDHIDNQAAWMEWLSDLGYYTSFATGFVEAQQVISSYLSLRKPDQIVKAIPRIVDKTLRATIA